jgi:DHA2 family multidrug resistance protein
LNDRTNSHFHDLASRLNGTNEAMVAQHASLRQLWHVAYREASTLAYEDAFRAIMLAFVVATLLVPLLRNVGAVKPPADAH